MGSRWEMERKKDPYYRRAKSEDYRSRASYTLKQLNKRFKIIKEGSSGLGAVLLERWLWVCVFPEGRFFRANESPVHGVLSDTYQFDRGKYPLGQHDRGYAAAAESDPIWICGAVYGIDPAVPCGLAE